jgi:MSHA biogenesis protein MshI
MARWFSRGKKGQGWFASTLNGDALDYAHVLRGSSGGPAIDMFGTRALAGENNKLNKVAREMELDRYPCTTLLQPADYQLLLVEAPNVPKPELKSAMRWRIKDMIDYHVDDATLDLLDIPAGEAGSARARMMFAVCARNDSLQACIRAYQEARIPLSVIDIRETAQRNVGALFEEEGRGLAVAYFGDDWGLLTINFRSELFLARRMEIGLAQLSAPGEAAKGDAFERVALELQRTLDHFDRQFQQVPVARLLIAPLPNDIGLAAYLGGNLTVPVEEMKLGDTLRFDGPPPDQATQWRLFHHFGAALRHESRAF